MTPARRHSIATLALFAGIVVFAFGDRNSASAQEGLKKIAHGKATYKAKGGHAAWKTGGRIVGRLQACPGCKLEALLGGEVAATFEAKKGAKVYELEGKQLRLKPGTYALRVTAKGYETLVVEGLAVKANNDLWVNLEF